MCVRGDVPDASILGHRTPCCLCVRAMCVPNALVSVCRAPGFCACVSRMPGFVCVCVRACAHTCPRCLGSACMCVRTHVISRRLVLCSAPSLPARPDALAPHTPSSSRQETSADFGLPAQRGDSSCPHLKLEGEWSTGESESQPQGISEGKLATLGPLGVPGPGLCPREVWPRWSSPGGCKLSPVMPWEVVTPSWPQGENKVTQCQQEAEEVTQIMQDNYSKVLDREGKLQDLDSRAEELLDMVLGLGGDP